MQLEAVGICLLVMLVKTDENIKAKELGKFVPVNSKIYNVLPYQEYEPTGVTEFEITSSEASLFDEEFIINGDKSTKYVNTCKHTPGSSKSICPENAKLLSSNLHCIFYEQNQAFPPTCPFPHFLPYHDILHITDKYFRNEGVWIQAFRNISSGFPDFTWIENYDNYYETNLHKTIENFNNVSDKNCLIRNNKTVYRVSCSERHTVICIYSFEELIIKAAEKICKKEKEFLNSDFCIMAHYDLTQPTCFCEKSNRFQPPKKNFCKKLAEPIWPYQTQLLINAVQKSKTGQSKCWIGFEKGEILNTYKWSSTGGYVQYTEWAKPYNCKFSEGAMQFGRYNYAGWTLQKDRTLHCAICEAQISLKQLNLFLYRHYANYSSIILYIENMHVITDFRRAHDIYCFSDDNDDGFKTTVSFYPTNNNYFFQLKIDTNVSSHYWCEAYQFSSSNVVKSNVLVSHWNFDYTYEFSIHIKAKISPEIDPFINNQHLEICEEIKQQLKDYYEIVSVRPMRGYLNESKYYMNMIVHLTILKTLKTATIERLHIEKLLKNMSIVENISSSKICPLTTTNTIDGVILEWPETRIGATAIPSNKLCLDQEKGMLPVTRKCEGDFLNGGKWGETVGTCFDNTTYPEITEELFNFLYHNISAENLTTNLLRITQEYAEEQSIDIHLIAQNLEQLDYISKNQVDGHDYTNIVSNIMEFDKNTLIEAQLLLNSTDKILSSLDSFLNNKNSTSIVSLKLITRIIDLPDLNIWGVGLYKETPEANSFEQYKLLLLYHNTSLRNVMKDEQLEIAIKLPPEILNSNYSNKLIVTGFYNDNLFQEEETDYDVAKIISISTPGVTGRLDEPIQIFFKIPEGQFTRKSCTHWEYGINSLSVSMYGHWKFDQRSHRKYGILEMCEFYHMTHFGHLLKIDVDNHENLMDIITAIGSALSLIGILPIYATALIFKSWRKRPGNIILLNYCIAIILQITLTFLLYAINNDGILCKIVGVLMHYSILSEFCWMLMIAVLQYKRYVIVFTPREANILKKSLLVGWVIPSLPVLITLSVSPNNYPFTEEQQFCFIAGYYFNFALLLPITVILSINAIIFGIIMYNITQSNVTICVIRNNDYKREILLAFLLFFILGLTWMFGILGMIGAGIWFTYMFCLTATLRGLVLFLYFIFGNKETRLLWKTRFTYLRHKILLYLRVKWTRL